MKRMQVLGIELKDYTVREAMRMVDEFLRDAKVNTVSFLSMEDLMNAGEDEDLKNRLSAIDLMIPTSAQILQAAGIAGRGRLSEVEEGKFYHELLKKISNEKRTAFILTGKEDAIEPFAQYLQEAAPGLKIVGTYAFETLTGDPDVIVNEINSTFPDLVLSKLTEPEQESFVYEHNTKLNAKLWVALKDEVTKARFGQAKKGGKLRELIRSKLFLRRVSRFTNEQENKGENS